MITLPFFTWALFGVIQQGQLLELPPIQVHGPTLLNIALKEDKLSHDRKLLKEDRESHARAFHLEIKRAFDQLLIEAKAGEIESMYRLGAYGAIFSKEGIATMDKCLPWLELAATKGHPVAPFDCAVLLLESNIHSDKIKGFDWMKRSTEVGTCRSQAAVHLVRFYSYGSKDLSVKRNEKVALEWAEKGAKLYGTSVGEFLVENGLQSPDKIRQSEIQFQ